MDRCRAIVDFCNLILKKPSCLEFAIQNLFSSNISISSPLGEKIGRHDLKDHLEMWLRAFSDLEFTGLETSQKDNTVVVMWSVKGIHNGVFSSILPTKKPLEFSGISIWEFDTNDQVESLTYRADMLGFFKQLGFYLEKDAYPNQSEIRGNHELLLKTLMKFGTEHDILTRSEVTCLAFYVNGLTAKQIAEEIGRSYRTVQVHIANAMDKLGCNHKNQLYDRMSNNGLKHIFRDLYDLLQEKTKQRNKIAQ